MSVAVEETDSVDQRDVDQQESVPENKKPEQRFAGWLAIVPLSVAILALLGFTWLIIYLIGRTQDASELEWTRSVYLLSGVEAVAFAAAGFLFGREVHRQQAEKAEEREAEANEKADQAMKTATQAEARAMEARVKGESLKAAIDAKATATSNQKTPSNVEIFGPGGTRQPRQEATPSNTDLTELRTLAEKLFPS